MRFKFLLTDELPKLAWCARMTPGSDTVLVEHGPWVETKPGGFFEGAWNGPFEEFGFDTSELVVGSGGKETSGGVAFVGPSHALERLHSIRTSETLFISNSLAYLLSSSRQELDPNYLFYESDFLTLSKGYHRAKRTFPLQSGRVFHVFYCGQIAVGSDLSVTRLDHKSLPHFQTYDEYVEYLRRELRRIHANATSRLRSVHYRPLTTLSSGYDSAACSVLAGELGCQTAVSFVKSRDYAATPVTHHDDCSRSVAEVLSLQVREFGRNDYLAKTNYPEAEFLACGNGGDDVVMSVMASELSQTLLFTGFRGDLVWDAVLPATDASRHHGSKDPAGASLAEFRLRVGFIHLPVPSLTLSRHSELFELTKSAEMNPWRLGNDYDRPIARRLVENAGVPRESFGQEKRGVTQPFRVMQENLRLYSERSAADLKAYAAALSSQQGLAPRLHRLVGWVLLQIVWRGNRYFKRVHLKLPQSYRLVVSETPLRFHWAMAKLIERYRSCSQFSGKRADLRRAEAVGPRDEEVLSNEEESKSPA